MPSSALDGYETAARAAERLGIDRSQVRRYCEGGRLEGAFKPHPRLWLVPKYTTPERKGSGRSSAWAKRAGGDQAREAWTERSVTE